MRKMVVGALVSMEASCNHPEPSNDPHHYRL